MKGFLELARKRSTCYEFDSRKVSADKLNRILEAARWSPSPANIQPWKFIVVRDPAKIAKMMRLAFFGGFHTRPDVLIAIALNCQKASGNRCDVINSRIGMESAHIALGAAAMSIILEATELGLGSCLLTPADGSGKILKNVGKDPVPILVGLGYQAKGAFQKKRSRLEMKELVAYEGALK